MKYYFVIFEIFDFEVVFVEKSHFEIVHLGFENIYLDKIFERSVFGSSIKIIFNY
jgi:hypothetical protein